MGPDFGSTDDLVRDTYAQFGVAVFRAQTLEVEIVKAMVIARLHEKDHTSRQNTEIDAFMKVRPTVRKSRGACQCQGAEQSARVRPSGKTSWCSWFVAL